MLNNHSTLAIGLLVAIFSVSSGAVAGKGNKSGSKHSSAQVEKNAPGNTYRYQTNKADKPKYQYRNTHQFTHNYDRKRTTVNQQNR